MARTAGRRGTKQWRTRPTRRRSCSRGPAARRLTSARLARLIYQNTPAEPSRRAWRDAARTPRVPSAFHIEHPVRGIDADPQARVDQALMTGMAWYSAARILATRDQIVREPRAALCPTRNDRRCLAWFECEPLATSTTQPSGSVFTKLQRSPGRLRTEIRPRTSGRRIRIASPIVDSTIVSSPRTKSSPPEPGTAPRRHRQMGQKQVAHRPGDLSRA